MSMSIFLIELQKNRHSCKDTVNHILKIVDKNCLKVITSSSLSQFSALHLVNLTNRHPFLSFFLVFWLQLQLLLAFFHLSDQVDQNPEDFERL